VSPGFCLVFPGELAGLVGALAEELPQDEKQADRDHQRLDEVPDGLHVIDGGGNLGRHGGVRGDEEREQGGERSDEELFHFVVVPPAHMGIFARTFQGNHMRRRSARPFMDAKNPRVSPRAKTRSSSVI